MSTLIEGTKINNRYTLKQYIGQGSFGEVWLADDDTLGEEVAIKLYIALDHDGVREFETEYETTAGLWHQNLLTAKHFDTWENRPFLVMEYCPDGPSSQYKGALNEDQLWQFIRDVSAGLAYLHQQDEPIVHQDIKPANILFGTDGNYKISDFGISTKVRDTMARFSGNRNAHLGAQAYMAPERFAVDSAPLKASDIWALGVTLYELVTSRLPFNGMGGGMLKGGAEVPHLPTTVSERLDNLVRACMQKNTWDRPTAQDLLYYSQAVLRGESPAGPWESAPATIPAVGAASTNINAAAMAGDEEDTLVDTETAEYKTKKTGMNWFKSMRYALWGVIALLALVVAYKFISRPTDKDDEKTEATNTKADKEKEASLLAQNNADDSEAAGQADDAAEGEGSNYATDAADGNTGCGTTDAQSQKPTEAKGNADNKATAPAQAPAQTKTTAPSTAPVRNNNATAKTTADPTANNFVAPNGYKGPEDTGRPQNQVDRRDYVGQDRNGHASRNASAPTTNPAYKNQSNYKKRSEYTPEAPTTKVYTVPRQSKPTSSITDESVRTAVNNGDYATVKRMAESGNSQAYLPMAEYSLRNGDYAAAEAYAKKAKAAGYSGGERVLKLLEKSGYYD